MNKNCGSCKFWNFKVQASKVGFGQCLNDEVQESLHISTIKVQTGLVLPRDRFKLLDQLNECEIYTLETFGCIYFLEAKKEII